jgi:hypothetical protein
MGVTTSLATDLPVEFLVRYLHDRALRSRRKVVDAAAAELEFCSGGKAGAARPAVAAAREVRVQRAEAAREASEAVGAYEAALRLLADQARGPGKPTERPSLVGDAPGYEHLRPRPLDAQTPSELVAVLREFRHYAGQPSFRVMAARASQRVAHSTMCEALGRDELPRQEVVTAIVSGCGGSDADVQEFVTAWRLISSGKPGRPLPHARLRSVPPHAGSQLEGHGDEPVESSPEVLQGQAAAAII